MQWDYRSVSKMKRAPTAAVQWACIEAKAALILAIEAVDELFPQDEAALEHPELVTAFMMFAGSAYRAKQQTAVLQ
jgi:hypothetical protein